MTPERFQRLEALFEQACQLASAERAAFLQHHCPDADLRADVEALLAESDDAGGFMERPAIEQLAGAPAAALDEGTSVGRYRIVRLLGAGGMGEVYLAHDPLLARDVALKILPPLFAADPEWLRRFTAEAKAASALNHPGILTVHEIGVVDGVHYIATEFVEGETLRQVIGGGPLPIERVFAIGIQAAAALGAAHRAGVVHRDLKPENIMVRPDGFVKVLDFGLAKQAGPASESSGETRVGLIRGTLRYLSPEQARGHHADARSDVFALGIVLYEMVAGRPPFDGPTATDTLAALIEREPDSFTTAAPVPRTLDRTIRTALQKAPDARYADGEALAMQLRAAAASASSGRPRRVRRLAIVGGVAALGALTIAGWSRLGGPRAHVRDSAVVAEFVNTTGDPIFDDTLSRALTIGLQQTPFLTLFPDDGVRETLRYMGRAEDAAVDPQVAREICERRGLGLVFVGRIAPLGTSYVLTLEARDCASGRVEATAQAQSPDKEHVLQGLDQVIASVRQALGESAGSLATHPAALEQATTASLDGLKAFSRGMRLVSQERWREEIPFLEQAIAHDPDFAAAYDWLAWAQSMLGDTRSARSSAERGYALRHRTSERERFSIASTYHHFVTENWEAQDEGNRQVITTFPNNWPPYADLTINEGLEGKQDAALRHARELMRLNPDTVQGYQFAALALTRLDQFDEALDVIHQAMGRGLDSPIMRNNLAGLAFLRDDQPLLKTQLQWMRDRSPAIADGIEAGFAGAKGQWHAAERLYKTAGRGTLGPAAVALAAALGWCDAVSAHVADGFDPAQTMSTQVWSSLPIQADGTLCGGSRWASSALAGFASRFPDSTQFRIVHLPAACSAIALTEHATQEAIDAVAGVPAEFLPGARGGLASYLRGTAFAQAGRPSAAVEEFRAILDHPGRHAGSVFYPLARLGLARAFAQQGDRAAANREYDRLFEYWRDADADLPVLVAARHERTAP